MKKFYSILFLFLLLAVGANADPVSKETALKSAQSFLSKRHLKATENLSLAYKSVRSHASKGKGVAAKDAYYYVFNNEEGGFVIVSGDDATEEILGYSDTGSFDVNNIPENLKVFLDGYQEEITYARNKGIRRANNATEITEPSKQVVAPLITTVWNQGEPYNLKCFTTNNQQAKTGCVATAFAQVMYYHKWPQSATTTIPGYSSYSALPSTTFNWNAMLPCYTEHLAETETQKNAVATLMQYCGYAVKMNYGTYESGASTSYIPDALSNYFRYQNKAVEIFRDSYDAAKWDDLIYHELQYRRPVIYSAETSSGSGHAFICDGFDGYGLFHINWGWGGMSDGYFRLQALNPNSQGTGGSSGYGGYSLSQSAIVGISPTIVNDKFESGEEEKCGIETMSLNLVDNNWNDIVSNEITVDYNSYYGLHNMRVGYKYFKIATDGPYDIGIGLFNGDEMIDQLTLNTNYDLPSTSWYWNASSLYGFGDNLSDGQYVIKGIDCPSGTGEWVPSSCSDKYYITLEIKNGKAIAKCIIEESNTLIEITKVEQDMSSTSPMNVNAYVKNNSDKDFNGRLFLLYDGSLVAYEGAYLAPGEEDYVTFAFNGTDGSHQIVISQESNGNSPLYSQSMTLKGLVTVPRLTVLSDEIRNVVGNKLYGNMLDGTLILKNETSTDYNNLLTFKLWRSKNGTTNGYFGIYESPINLSIPAGQTEIIPISSPLATGELIYFEIYDANGNILDVGPYTVTAGVVKWFDNGERIASAPTTSTTVPSDVVAISFEGLNTSSMTITPNSNSNTIYYFDADATIPSSLSGKNVVKGYKAVGNFNLQDGYSFFVPKMFTVNGTASYTRTTTVAGTEQAGWSTIVLPFTVSQVKNADANQQITWRHPSDNENKDFWLKEFKGVNDTKVIFENVDTWMPNEPYIISVPSALTGQKMVFSNTNTQVYPTETCKKVTSDYSFIGTPFNQTLSDVYVMNVGGTTFQPSENATVNAGNAYFTLAPTLSPRPTNIPISTGLLGDANGDGIVNISDAVLVVNYILGDRESNIVFENADINLDNEINVTDAVGIVNIILGQ